MAKNLMSNQQKEIDARTSHIIELAWCDDTSFETIEEQFGVPEKEVIKIMRGYLKPKSFKVWRERASGRKQKHKKLNASQKVQPKDFAGL
jgi:uncharacterized protein (TIGR03643 family)